MDTGVVHCFMSTAISAFGFGLCSDSVCLANRLVLSDAIVMASWMVIMAALLCLTHGLRKDGNPDFPDLGNLQPPGQVPDMPVPPVPMPEEAAVPNLEQIMQMQKELAGGSWRWSRMTTLRRFER